MSGDDRWIEAELHRLDEAVVDLRRTLQAQYDTGQAALEAQRRDLDRRVEALNEFRAQLATQQEAYITRSEYEAKHDAIAIQLAAARDLIQDVKQNVAWTTGRALGALGAVVFLLTVTGLIIRFLK